MINLNLLFLFLAVSLFAYALLSIIGWFFTSEKQAVDKRINDISADVQVELSNRLLYKKDELSRYSWLNKILRHLQFTDYLQYVVAQAALSLRVGDLLMMMLFFGCIGIIATLHFSNPVVSIIGGVFLGFVPFIFVNFKMHKRHREFEYQLPDALDIMRSAIRAGYALNKAIHLVGTESPDPIGIEFRKTAEEVSLGIPVNDALMNLGSRVDILDLRLIITAILIQRDSGGNLNEILQGISKTIRARFRLAGQLRIYTAQGKATQLLLTFLPVFFGCMMFLLNPDYIKILFTHEIGKVLLVIAFFMQLSGYLVISRMIRLRIK